MLLRVKFFETVHSHATQQNAKELSASSALLYLLKIAVIRKSPASRQMTPLTLTRMMYMSESKMVVADALARIDSVLEAVPMQVQAVPQHPKDSSVTLRDVHFSYDGKTEVIKGVSLEIQPGQTVAFVGPSGGGKSTLANLVCRFFDVQSGSVRVGGADVRDIPKEELMDTISFVFQNSRLLKGSILDNVRLGRPQATEAEVLAALKAAQCMDIVEKFPAGIHTVIGTKGVYPSGGEQQRIATARAMLKNAPILILDEATASFFYSIKI